MKMSQGESFGLRMRSSRRRKAMRAIATRSWRTVVSGGVIRLATGRSAKPVSSIRLRKNGASFAVDYLVAGNFVAECRTVYHTIEERTASIGGIRRAVVELEMGDRTAFRIVL